MKQSCTEEEYNLIVAQVEKDYEDGGGKPSAVTPNFATSIQAPASSTAPKKNLDELAKEALMLEESDDDEDDEEFENDSQEENNSNDDSKPAAIPNSKSSDNKNQVASVEKTNHGNLSDDVSTDTKTEKRKVDPHEEVDPHHAAVIVDLIARRAVTSNSTNTLDNKEKEEPKVDDSPEYFDVQEKKRCRVTGGKTKK